MRYLLFAPLLPIAIIIWLAIRNRFPKADPEEIYVWLFISVMGAIVPSAGIGLVCRFLEGREIMEMPSWTWIYAAGWVLTALYIVGHFYFDSLKQK